MNLFVYSKITGSKIDRLVVCDFSGATDVSIPFSIVIKRKNLNFNDYIYRDGPDRVGPLLTYLPFRWWWCWDFNWFYS